MGGAVLHRKLGPGRGSSALPTQQFHYYTSTRVFTQAEEENENIIIKKIKQKQERLSKSKFSILKIRTQGFVFFFFPFGLQHGVVALESDSSP